MFNLNNPRNERNERDGAFLQNQPPPEGGEQQPPTPPPPPRQPGRKRGPNQGPPDLDELWRDFNRRLSGMFGGGGNDGGRPGGPDFQPNMKNVGVGLAVLAVVALVVWLASGAFTVDQRLGEKAVITRFGRYQATVDAGFNWRLPVPIEWHETVGFSQIRSVDVGRDDLNRSTGLRDSAMLTKDENIVQIKLAVQYHLSDARAFLFNSEKPDEAVVQAAESAVREVVGQMTMDNAMGDERDQIAPRVRDLTQKILDRYQVGIEITAVNMGQEGVRAPDQVKDAFDDVIKAGQEREGAKNRAQAYANGVVQRATGEAARLTQDAQAYKARAIARAQGDAERFSAVLAEYQKAPKVTRDRLYLDAMRQVYGGASKIIVDGKAGANLLVLPLDKMAQVAAAAGVPPPAAGAEASASASAAAAPAPVFVPDIVNARGRDNERNRERDPR